MNGHCSRQGDCGFCHHSRDLGKKRPVAADNTGSFYATPKPTPPRQPHPTTLQLLSTPTRPQADPWTDEDPWSNYKAYPIFEWNEDAKEREVPATQQPQEKVYHSSARISETEEGLLVDTGSRGNLMGKDLIDRQSAAATKHGLPVAVWTDLTSQN